MDCGLNDLDRTNGMRCRSWDCQPCADFKRNQDATMEECEYCGHIGGGHNKFGPFCAKNIHKNYLIYKRQAQHLRDFLDEAAMFSQCVATRSMIKRFKENEYCPVPPEKG